METSRRCIRCERPITLHPNVVRHLPSPTSSPGFGYVAWAVAWQNGYCSPTCCESHALNVVASGGAWWQRPAQEHVSDMPCRKCGSYSVVRAGCFVCCPDILNVQP